MPFSFEKTAIDDVIVITPRAFNDDRGFFMETYKRSDFINNGIKEDFVQDNHSKSTKGVLRGLHYQKAPKAQAKIVRCIKGAIFDVAVDIRKGSKTYGKWVGVELTEENKKMLYIPAGFAHGFCVRSEVAEICYKSSDEYSPENDRGIIWNDSEIGIDWNLDAEPVISEKDSKHPLLKDADNNF